MSLTYALTTDAANDLDGIWQTSLDRWGPDQADRYLAKIEDCAAAPPVEPSAVITRPPGELNRALSRLNAAAYPQS